MVSRVLRSTVAALGTRRVARPSIKRGYRSSGARMGRSRAPHISERSQLGKERRPNLHSILPSLCEVDYTCRRLPSRFHRPRTARGMGETVRRVSERRRPCVSDRSRRVDIRHDPSFTSPRCRGGSGSPPESWRRRGLEHGIHPRRRPSRSDRAERDCRSNHGPGDRFSHITQLITIGAAERLRDDGETPRCASPPNFQAETHTRTRSKRSAASTGPPRPGSRTRSKPYRSNRSVRMQR